MSENSVMSRLSSNSQAFLPGKLSGKVSEKSPSIEVSSIVRNEKRIDTSCVWGWGEGKLGRE
jgi:hypothetical protein